MNDYGEPPGQVGDCHSYRVKIRNDRKATEVFSLDQHGFCIETHKTKLNDFEQNSSIEKHYYPEIERLVKRITNAKRVDIFDHTIRSSQDANLRTIANHVHNDYTEKSCPQRLRDHLGDQLTQQLLKRRVIQVNVWRPLS